MKTLLLLVLVLGVACASATIERGRIVEKGFAMENHFFMVQEKGAIVRVDTDEETYNSAKVDDEIAYHFDVSRYTNGAK